MKKILLLLLMCLSVLTVDAQRRKKDTINLCLPGHYLVADLGGGIHTLNYKISERSLKSLGPGLNFRAGYRYFFNEHWGIGSELNLKSYMSAGTLTYVQFIDNVNDFDYDNEAGANIYQHRTYFDNFRESQRQLALSIPIGAYYQYRIDRQWQIGAGLGALFQFNQLSYKYKLKDGSLETTGYYEMYNAELYDMPHHHYYTKNDLKGNYQKQSNFGICGEGNAYYYLNPRLSLDLGFYFAYGFKNQNTKNETYLYDPDVLTEDQSNAHYNGILESSLVDKIHPFAIGVMAGIRYRLKFEHHEKIKDDDIKKHQPDTTPETDTILVKPDIDAIVPVIVDTVVPVPVVPVDTIVPVPVDTVVPVPVDTVVPVVVDTVVPVPVDTVVPVPVDTVVPVPVDTIVPVIVDNETDNKPVDTDVDLDLEKFRRVSVNYAFNDTIAHLNLEQRRMIDNIAKLMKQHPETTIKIVGHTCDIGTLEQNMLVGKKRAESCKNELIKRGISADRIQCESKAFLEPLVPNTSETNRRKNRRIEFLIQ